MVRDEWSSVYAVGCPTGSAATKQSTWDRAVTALERQTVINSLSNATDRARLLSVTSPHSSDWLHALPLSGCGRRLDDRAIHITVGLDWEQTYASLTSAFVERLLTQEDCMVCLVEWEMVDPQGITT